MLVLGALSIPNWVVYLLVVVLLIYYHYVKNFTFWRKQGISGPTPWPLIGSINRFLVPTPAHEIDLKNQQLYGLVHGKYESAQKILVVNDVDFLKQILIKDQDIFRNRRDFGISDETLTNSLLLQKDEPWKKSRKVFSPTFSTGKIRNMSRLTKDCCKETTSMLRKVAENGESFDVLAVFRKFAISNMAKCIFGIDINVEDPNNPFVVNTRKMLQPDFSLSQLVLFICPLLAKYLQVSFIHKKVSKFFKDLTERVFEARKKVKSDREDFVKICQDIMEGINDSDEEMKRIFSYANICHHGMAFISAGVETTTTALGCAAYNLARHPDIQKRVIEEVHKSIEKHGDINYQALMDMPYLSAAIDESLRLYPPLITGERLCSQDYQLGSVFIPKGAVIQFSIYNIHRNSDYWPDAEKYDPERFMNPEQFNQYAYMPFLQGQRSCIAKRFALMNVKLCLATILENMRFKESPLTEVPLKISSNFDALIPENLKLMLELQ